MTVNAVKAAAGAAGEAKSFPKMLEAYKGHIAMALPKHMNADRMARIAMTAFRQNPKLDECHPASIFAAVIVGSQLGLEPGILGQAYLVPYKGECQFIPGWQGYVDLVSRAGRASVWTGAVFQGDSFDYELGDRPFVKHQPTGEDDPAKLTHVYAIGRIKGADVPIIEVWTRAKVEKHRDRFNKVGSRHYSFQHFEMYGRKVALLQVIKYMPKSIELQQLAELDQAAENGGQKLDPKQVIEGTWTAPAAAPESDGLDIDAARASIAAATSVQDLAGRWQAISDQARAAGVTVPVELDGAYTDRKAALEQKL
jgi:recombination protein RecT